ncbi:MAG: hypothetical protein H8E44_02900 [Planctomycetes bacterium]|nr:hypothetical protein [Planctomycetota bacterium]MBL7037741.1 hypothetical protein [Pirellulaceae bacterium]
MFLVLFGVIFLFFAALYVYFFLNAIVNGRINADLALTGIRAVAYLILGLALTLTAYYEATDEAVEVPRQSDRMVEDVFDRDK